MYAVIESGGKQYRVEVGSELQVELLDVEPGQAITIDRVLLVADGDETAIGRPVVANATVEAEVLRRDRADKVIVFKYRPKARRRVKKGHRQSLTVLRVTDVRLGSKSAAESVRKAEAAATTERQRLEEAAARQAAADAELAARLAKPPKGEEAEAKPAKAAPKSTARTPAKTKTRTSAASEASSAGEAAPADDAPKKTRARAKATDKTDTDAPDTDKTGTDAPDTDAPPKRGRAKKDE